MKIKDFLLNPALAVTLVMWLPVSSTAKVYSFDINEFDRFKAEAAICYAVAVDDTTKPDVKPSPASHECTCGGKGYILADGKIKIPCPAGDNCVTKKKPQPAPKPDDSIPEPPKPVEPVRPKKNVLGNKQVYMVSGETCPPCIKFKGMYHDSFVAEGYGFDDDAATSQVVITTYGDERFKNITSQISVQGLPTFIFVENGKVKKYYVGFDPNGINGSIAFEIKSFLKSVSEPAPGTVIIPQPKVQYQYYRQDRGRGRR